ncbi:MAG: TetR/AcrR family transcriptional regulator [Pseudomonadota bacterium]
MNASVLRILTASQEISAGSGLDSLRVDVVAEQAGLNKRMIYHYFGSKEGLQHALLIWQVQLLVKGEVISHVEYEWIAEQILEVGLPNDWLGDDQSFANEKSGDLRQLRMAASILIAQLCMKAFKIDPPDQPEFAIGLMHRLTRLNLLGSVGSSRLQKQSVKAENRSKPRLRIRSKSRKTIS